MKNRPNILLLLMAGLRIHGLDWSLPHTYEEATPLRVAIGMWGWQHNGPVTFNPDFFNYPSLTFYIHFLVQGLVFLVLRLANVQLRARGWQTPASNPRVQERDESFSLRRNEA